MSKNQNKSRHEPLAIVGMGCIFPKAGSLSSYWSNIKEGVDAITEIPATHWKPSDYFDQDPNEPDMTYARRGGFIDPLPFDPLLYGISPNNIEATDTTQLLGMVAAREALLDAGYATGRDSNDGRQFDRDRTSVILGVTGTLELVIPLGARLGHPIWRRALRDAGIDDATAEDVVQRIAEGYVPWQENSFPGLLGNVTAGRIANRFDLGGTNCVVDAACASSLSAIHMAAMELSAGRSDMVISGGVDTFNDIFMYMCFSKTPALSPTGNSRPFHANGDGTILGEGIGMVVLKRLADAKRDGDHIYALIKGIGTSSDGKGNAIYAPSPAGQQKALRDAYRMADVAPHTVELVEAHGTGTRVGDAVEAEALSGVYREDRAQGSWCAIGSVKSMIGHTKAAAGVAGLIKIVMALQHKVLPPTIKVEQPLESLKPGTAPVYVNTVKRPWVASPEHPRRAGVSAFGFGGSNFHAVLEEAADETQAIDWDGRVLLFAFAGDDKQSLQKQLTVIEQAAGDWQQLRKAAALSLRDYEADREYRLLLVLERERTDTGKLLESARAMLSGQEQPFRHTGDGACLGSGGTPPGGLALLFPGQGAQYPGMLRDLACQFPSLLSAIDEANAALGVDAEGCRLSDRIYPIPVFEDSARDQQKQALTATVTAQPAIGAISNGCTRILEQFGIRADASAGHSFGELTALQYAGWFSGQDLFRLAQKRGQLMQQGGGDHGAMLAVIATPEDLHELIEEHQLDLIIANHNAPAQLVLSGASEQISKAEAILGDNNIHVSRLPVAAAFHSSFVAGAEKPFAEFINTIEFCKGRIPVYSNTTAEVYNDNVTQARAQLAGQLAQPVEFVREIENMYNAGIRTFVEAGPSNIITGLVNKILAEQRDYHAIALDASKGRRSGQYDLALLLARLSALGYHCDVKQWDAGYLEHLREEKVAALTIPISGANYVLPRDRSKPVTRPVAVKPVQATIHNVPAPDEQQRSATTMESRNRSNSAALQATQQGILALQKLQEQTAQLHKQYLEGQENAQRTIQELLRQQQQLINGVPVSLSVTDTPQQQPEAPITSPVTEQASRPEAGDHDPPRTTTATEQRDNEQVIVTNSTQYQNILLQVVAEKTGYPVDMLSLDMSLDTDLGIDSIKRVEILSALQEKLPGIQKIQPEDLGTFQLLQHIVEYLALGDVATSVVAEANLTPKPARSTGFQQALLEVVADKTGYPADMLNLDMNLDSDLGIDSIKRVEILSALQERLPEAPAVKPEQLGQLQTLRQIVEFMEAENTPPDTAAVPTAAFDNTLFRQTLLEVVADKTGYPVDMLNLDMNLDSDLGIDSIKRVEILSALQERLPEAPAVKPEQLGQLQTLQQIVDFLQNESGAAKQPHAQPATRPAAAQETPGEECIYRTIIGTTSFKNSERKIFNLPQDARVLVTDDGTGLSGRICELLLNRQWQAQVIDPDSTITGNIDALLVMLPIRTDYTFIRHIFNLIQQAGRRGVKVLTGVTRLGGRFGFSQLSSGNPEAAAIHGIIKTADKEWPDVNCKVIDIAEDCNDLQLARTIVEEMLTTGPLELGIDNGGERLVLSLQTERYSRVRNKPDNPFSQGDVVVITGGARGITAEVAYALARTYSTSLLLLGRSPEPETEPDWLAGLTSETEIKQAIIKQAAAQKPSPKTIEHEYRSISNNREILNNLERIRQTGVSVIYRSVDVRDTHQVIACIDQVRRDSGPIRGIIHGAGILADRFIVDKTPEQFHEVYSTKVDGVRALLKATQQDDLKIMVLFSSSTARFGRRGQVDYAAANEVLNKIAQQQQIERPACRVLSVNWGPWAGGMVTPHLEKVFEAEGIGLIPLAAGADYLMHEIASPGPVEVVVLGSEPLTAGEADVPDRAITPDMQLAFERNLNVEDFPVLKSHVINGSSVLPAALIAEWLAHGAMHNNPGSAFIGFDDFRILKGVILENGENITLQIMAGPVQITGNRDRILVELRHGSVLHARAQIILSAEYEKPVPSDKPVPAGDYACRNGDYYHNGQLFHGDDLRGIQSVDGCSEDGITGTVSSAPAPAAWSKNPIRSTWLADPLVMDCCFQLMILWSFKNRGAGSLPTGMTGYRQYQRTFPEGNVRIVSRIVKAMEHNAVANIEILDLQGNLIASMEGYDCVIDSSLNEAFRKNQPLQILDQS